MESIKLEQLIQATSGLKNRKEALVFSNGESVVEIRISFVGDSPYVDLITEEDADI